MNSTFPAAKVFRAEPGSREWRRGAGEAAAIADELTVTEVCTTEGFSALAAEWRTLLAQSEVDCLFLTWEWLYTWWRCLAGSRRLLILVVHRKDTLVGIAPFAVRAPEPKRLLPFRAIEFLGVGAVGSDYLDLVLKKGEEARSCAVIADYMAKWNLMLDMRRVALGTAHVERLVRELEDRGWSTLRRDDDICLYVPLSGSSWDEYFAGLNRKFRRALRRGRRDAQSSYTVAYTTVSRQEDRPAALQAFIRLHNKRWDSRAGSQAVPDSSIVQFHEQWSRIALDRGWLRLSILHFDQTPVAGAYRFAYGGKLYFYLSGFDPAYATFGVGNICLEEGLREAFEEGLEEYDFLHGDERYKYHWAHEYRALVRYRLFPPGMRGYASRRFLETREGFKSLLGKGPRGGTDSDADGGRRKASRGGVER